VAPALSRLGLQPLVAHLFIFYYAIFAGLTPPVCPTVFIGAGLAGSDWLKTAWVALRLGIVAFIVPYMFVESPTLLLVGTPLNIISAIATATVGVVGLAGGIMGYFLRKDTLLERFFLISSGLLLIIPGLMTDLVGFALFAITIIIQKLRPDKTL
jgi:TRAP-type uncharacterized transport system fused permease subunit